jgi:hypothetical protein
VHILDCGSGLSCLIVEDLTPTKICQTSALSLSKASTSLIESMISGTSTSGFSTDVRRRWASDDSIALVLDLRILITLCRQCLAHQALQIPINSIYAADKKKSSQKFIGSMFRRQVKCMWDSMEAAVKG